MEQVLETYFGAEEEGDSEIMPEVVTGAGGTQQFNFGGPPAGGAGGAAAGGAPGPASFNF